LRHEPLARAPAVQWRCEHMYRCRASPQPCRVRHATSAEFLYHLTEKILSNFDSLACRTRQTEMFGECSDHAATKAVGASKENNVTQHDGAPRPASTNVHWHRHSRDDRLLYTVQEASRVTSLSRATIYRLIGSGDLPSVTIGRARRITHDALAGFLRGLHGAV
jgi:excisionase family DNA binding protein